MTAKEQNAKDLKRAWKKFLKVQNEKKKTKKENQKTETTGEMVSSAVNG